MRIVYMALSAITGLFLLGCSREPKTDGAFVKDGLVYIEFVEGGKRIIINTSASAYQQWSIMRVSDNLICFRSSDIGSSAYTLLKNGVVQKRPALYLREYGYMLYLLYAIDETVWESAYGRPSDGVELVAVCEESGKRCQKYISGKFRYKESNITLSKEGMLSIVGVDSVQTIDLSAMAKTDK